MMYIASEHSPGTVGLVGASLARYHEFTTALEYTYAPKDTRYNARFGINLAKLWNEIVRELHGEWLWMLNDDHEWDASLLMKLLDHRVEVIVPLIPSRHYPFPPVLQHGPIEEARYYRWAELPTMNGLWQLPLGDLCGAAGMLVRKSVFTALPDPWFEVGQVDSEAGMLDTYFCHKLAEADIPIHVDLSLIMPHFTTARITVRDIDGVRGPIIDFGSIVDLKQEPSHVV